MMGFAAIAIGAAYAPDTSTGQLRDLDLITARRLRMLVTLSVDYLRRQAIP